MRTLAVAALVVALTAAPAVAATDGTPWVVKVTGTEKGGFVRQWNDGHGQSLPPIHQARLACAEEPTYPEVQYCLGRVDGEYPEWTIEKRSIEKAGQ